MFDWGSVGTMLTIIAGVFVVYWVAMFFLVEYARRDLERRGIASWLSYAFLFSTPLGLILWLAARKFFPVQEGDGSRSKERRGLRG